MPLPPTASTSSAVSSIVSGRFISDCCVRVVRPVTYTVAPAAPSSTAIPRPAARVPPATNATFPASGPSMSRTYPPKGSSNLTVSAPFRARSASGRAGCGRAPDRPVGHRSASGRRFRTTGHRHWVVSCRHRGRRVRRWRRPGAPRCGRVRGGRHPGARAGVLRGTGRPTAAYIDPDRVLRRCRRVARRAAGREPSPTRDPRDVAGQ